MSGSTVHLLVQVLVGLGSVMLPYSGRPAVALQATAGGTEVPAPSVSPCANQNAPVRTRGEVEACGHWIVERYSDRQLAQYGILDATKAPYSADPTGIVDSTGAIQQAMKDARDARLITYLPGGTYLVSDTITCVQGVVTPDRWFFGRSSVPTNPTSAGEQNGFNYRSDYYPCVLMGSRSKRRTTIILAPNSSGFGNARKPKAVLDLWARALYSGPGAAEAWRKGGNINPDEHAPLISYNQLIVDIDLVLNRGNPGAVGIEHQAAQGSAIEAVNINATGAFAGIDTAPGSGGGIHGLSVIGGRYGLYLVGAPGVFWLGAQPVPVISDVMLKGQTERSILYDGRGPLTVVGGWIEGAGVEAQGPRGQPWNGAMTFVDAEFRMHSGECAVKSNRSVYLRNVYFSQVNRIACVQGRPALKGNPTGWTHVKEYAAAGTPEYPLWLGGGARPDALYVNGRTAYASVVQTDSTSPTADPRARHALRPLPSWSEESVANIRKAPYGAKGDGKTDDTEAIQRAIDTHRVVFVPKGIYLLSRPLVLRPHTQLFGIGNVLSVLSSTWSKAFDDPNQPAPVIDTMDAPSADTQLALVELRVPVTDPAVYALRWRAGRRSIVRNIRVVRTAWKPDAPPAISPMIRIVGSGGGRWYDLYEDGWWGQGPDYRHLLVEGTHEQLSFYMLNPEHARSDAQVEFSDAQNVNVYSLKAEGLYTVLWIRHCRHIGIYGYGGVAAPRPRWSVFRIDHSANFLLANVDPDQLINAPREWPWFFAGALPSDPRTSLLIRDQSDDHGKSVSVVGVNQTALYQRGNP